MLAEERSGENPLVTFLRDTLIPELSNATQPYGRKVYYMDDAELPVKRVAGFVKTQIDTFVRLAEAAEEEADEANGS